MKPHFFWMAPSFPLDGKAWRRYRAYSRRGRRREFVVLTNMFTSSSGNRDQPGQFDHKSGQMIFTDLRITNAQ